MTKHCGRARIRACFCGRMAVSAGLAMMRPRSRAHAADPGMVSPPRRQAVGIEMIVEVAE